VSIYKKSGAWNQIKRIYYKSGGVWTEINNVYYKASAAWTKVFSKNNAPGNTSKPQITGSSYLFGTLSGSLGSWTAPSGTNSYARQWKRATDNNGVPGTYSSISGATSATYTTVSADDNKWISIFITATSSGTGQSSTVAADAVFVNKYAPVNTNANSKPIITGVTEVFNTLTASSTWKTLTDIAGDTTPDTYTYVWKWGDTGALATNNNNSSSYTIATADKGHTIKVEITAKNSGGSTTVISDPTAVITGALPKATINTVIVSRDPNSYVFTITNNGTWTNSPTSYRYQWYVETTVAIYGSSWSIINGATSSSFDASSYKTQNVIPIVWASNSNGESTSGYAKLAYGGTGVFPGGNAPQDSSKVLYKLPTITTFTVTGGVRAFYYISNFSADDPSASARMTWSGASTNPFDQFYPTSSAVQRTYTPMGTAGLHNFTLTVTNTGAGAIAGSATSSVNNVNITVPADYSFAFGKDLYVSTNGYVGLLDSPSTNLQQQFAEYSLPRLGRLIAAYLRDLRQGLTTDTTGYGYLKYWSDASSFVVYSTSYNLGGENMSATAIDYQMKFYTNQSYVDINYIRVGASMPAPSTGPGLYLDQAYQRFGVAPYSGYNGFRIYLDGSLGSVGQYFTSIPSAAFLIAGGVTYGTNDDGYTRIVASANQYAKPLVYFRTQQFPPYQQDIIPGSTTYSVGITTGGNDMASYQYVLRKTSDSSLKASGTETLSKYLAFTTLTPSTQYTLTVTPYNSLSQAGDAITYSFTTQGIYTVTFNSNGATGSPSSASVTQASVGASVTLASVGTMTKSNSIFAGWSETGNTPTLSNTYTPLANITLYAVWLPLYAFTFSANGATGSPNISSARQTSSGGAVTLATIGTMAYTGKKFLGWSTSNTATTATYTSGSSQTPTSDTALYAVWVNLTLYTVNLFSNGGNAADTSVSQTTEGGSVTLPSSAGTNGTLIFGGWNTNSSGTGTNYAASATYTPTAATSLYAKWTAAPVTYTITYNANGGTGTTTATTGNGSVTLRANSFTRANATFVYWSTSPTDTGTSYSAGGSYPLNANVTLYAIWTPNANSATAPTVTFVGNSGNTKSWSWTASTVTGGTLVGYDYAVSSTNGTSGFGAFTSVAASPRTLSLTVTNAASNPRWLKVRARYTDGVGTVKTGPTNATGV
jgi:hypothetical protein